MIYKKITIVIIIFTLFLSMGCENFLNNDNEPDILSETNRVRTNPRRYAAELIVELNANRANWSLARIAEYEAAITTLSSSSARNPLSLDNGLSRAARDHAQDLIRNNRFSHVGSYGSSPNARMLRYGSYAGAMGENIAAGTSRNTGASMVLGWVLSPGHLANMLNVNYTLIGTAHLSGHPSYNWIAVQKFAGRRN